MSSFFVLLVTQIRSCWYRVISPGYWSTVRMKVIWKENRLFHLYTISTAHRWRCSPIPCSHECCSYMYTILFSSIVLTTETKKYDNREGNGWQLWGTSVCMICWSHTCMCSAVTHCPVLMFAPRPHVRYVPLNSVPPVMRPIGGDIYHRSMRCPPCSDCHELRRYVVLVSSLKKGSSSENAGYLLLHAH